MSMKYVIGVVAILIGSSVAASAQSAKEAPGNKAINSSGQNNSTSPVKGANSFTETQARDRLEEAGYSSIGPLKKDDEGVWRGSATKDGTASSVSVDFQGNVNAAK